MSRGDETIPQGSGEAGKACWGLTDQVLAACIEVHRHLGPGLLESAYSLCLADELNQRGLTFVREHDIPVFYKGRPLDSHYRADFVVGSAVILELKAVVELQPIHEAQLLTYLRLTQLPVGLLVNFHVPAIRGRAIRRLSLNNKNSPLPRFPVNP
jgi:GxxExxY protein